MKTKYIILSLLLFTLFACDSEDFLTRYPKDQLVEATTFTTNANFQTYAWKFYETFPGYRNKISYNQEMNSDLMVNNSGTIGQAIFWQEKTVPATSDTYTNGYAKIRDIHLMLDNIEGSRLTDDEKSHWEGVGRFFRAYEYFFLLKTFGPTPLIDRLLSDQDTTQLYKARATRDEMADFILADLQIAETKINPNGNGPNTINTDVVRALTSRFGLFEGTWRKYHNLGGGQKFLEASKAASTQLIAAHPKLHSDYDGVFNSESLKGVDGILLYKAYEFAVLTGIYAHHNRSWIGSEDITKKGADMFLCTDGQTIHTSPLFEGEQDPYTEFRNRDWRMYVNIVPPFRVDTDGKNQLTWKFDADPKHREYIDLMATQYPEPQKRLPTMNWMGLIVRTSPHFRKFNEGHSYNVTYSGYAFHKYYNTYSRLKGQDWNDAPIFRMGEVLLNHAELMWELGQFDQSVADQTINKLRDRGRVAHLDISNMTDDPTRDADVDPVLWEIRRERFVEYFGEGFGRALDIKRWKKLVEYGAQEKMGRWIVARNYNNKVPVVGGGAEGYVKIFGIPPGVPEHYYLEPLPSNEIVLNPKLIQNPGWDD